MTMLIQFPAPSEAALLLCEMGPRVTDRMLVAIPKKPSQSVGILKKERAA